MAGLKQEQTAASEETRPLTTKFVFLQLKKHEEKEEERFRELEASTKRLGERLYKAGVVCKELQKEIDQLKEKAGVK